MTNKVNETIGSPGKEDLFSTGLLMEFDSIRMRSNLVLVAMYKKGKNFKIFQNCKQFKKFHKIFFFFKVENFQNFKRNSKFSENFKALTIKSSLRSHNMIKGVT
jgi:hypothetical protein